MSDLLLTTVPPMTVGMLIRRAPHDVFRAFTEPSVTTRFWFTASTGRLTPGARLRWDWEMYGVSTGVTVTDVDEDRRVVFDWDDESPKTVELLFLPTEDGTYVRITETGHTGTGDEIVAGIADSTGGFTMVLCAAKALLEHGVALTVVADRLPAGLDL